MTFHTVEKIGGTSMSDYVAVRDNIILKPVHGEDLFQRIFVVSAYGGITNMLLEHKKNGHAGVYAEFANSVNEDNWQEAMQSLRTEILSINKQLFGEAKLADEADEFICERLDDAERVLADLQRLCQHGHFELDQHLSTVREMLASIGEAHSAWNTAQLLKKDGINAVFVDLTGWQTDKHMALDTRIEKAFADIDLSSQLPIVTGYAHSADGLMSTFDRGYSEMTFSRIAVLTEASEAIIHKEFHLSSADPRLVGEENAVPIGRTNYDVADQLANLGMEAIHPKAAKGLRQNDIPLRVRNTFEPEHAGTLITGSYVSSKPCVEIIAGCKGVFAFEVFDQDMAGNLHRYDTEILAMIRRFRAHIISKDINANTITHYLSASLKTIRRIRDALHEVFPEAEINQQKVSIVSAIGSDMKIPGILAKTVSALAEKNISVLAMHQSMRQVDMQFIIDEDDYDAAIKSLHSHLVEIHDHGRAICLAG
ncbi:Aspartokinase associated with ectoine biosynthesis [Methylophaga frappieri]|uniref:aspartate kinase n=1 Tax=Methylophaga frappieri (strain ATCC BAA-2434 / DSM 25690 / JAM7) TaxID=754477 RepID=I1YF27_METFJ|nr:aspartate kinase [Methylophaga frappieri]AFJ01520.1 Aspartokinase associated with ectoine biosynthesis [Methylophaga frappieri]